MAVGMHKMRLGRSLASLIGEGEGSEDALKAGRFNPRRNFSILDSVALRRRVPGFLPGSLGPTMKTRYA